VKALDEVGFLFARRGVRPEYQDGGEGSRGPAYDPKVDHPQPSKYAPRHFKASSGEISARRPMREADFATCVGCPTSINLALSRIAHGRGDHRDQALLRFGQPATTAAQDIGDSITG